MIPARTISDLREVYEKHRSKVYDIVLEAWQRAKEVDETVWIHLLEEHTVRESIEKLEKKSFEDSPLWGVPFAIKDNIDLAGSPTSAGCPEFAYVPDRSATVVERLMDAGAIPIGKTNLDQFATGLTGTRSPYGEVRNAIDAEYIAGGSSSGSAVAVAKGIVPFALGTDTAGSGRVPAAFQGLIGFKPTKGWWSTRGVVPACQSLDCVSVFTRTISDACTIAKVAGGFDPEDAYSRQLHFAGFSPTSPRIGVFPAHKLPWFGDQAYSDHYQAFVDELPFDILEVDPDPFLAAGKLLYEGPWLAERVVAVGEFMDSHADAVFPITRQIIENGRKPTAADCFKAQHQLEELRRISVSCFKDVDFVVAPTVPTHFSLSEVRKDPFGTNNVLGTFTNFVNLLDLCAVAVPARTMPNGLSFGVTILARAGSDHALLNAAAHLRGENLGISHQEQPGELHVAVCGAHMRGQPLNSDLTSRGGWFVSEGKTSNSYQLFALPDGKRPALVRSDAGGSSIEIEIWSLPDQSLGPLLTTITPPVALGKIELQNGRWVVGFVGVAGSELQSTDITSFGDWRNYLHHIAAENSKGHTT